MAVSKCSFQPGRRASELHAQCPIIPVTPQESQGPRMAHGAQKLWCGWLGNSIFRPAYWAYWAYCLLFRYSSLPWTLNFAIRELGVSKLIASAAFRVFACELKLRHDASPASYSSGFTNSWCAVSSPNLNFTCVDISEYIWYVCLHQLVVIPLYKMYDVSDTKNHGVLRYYGPVRYPFWVKFFFGHAYRDDIL